MSAIYIFGMALLLGFLIAEIHERDIMRSEVSTIEAVLHKIIKKQFPTQELTASEFEEDVDRLSTALELLLTMPELVRVKVYNREGVIIWSDEKLLIGRQFSGDLHIRQALMGRVITEILEPEDPEHIFEKEYEKVFEIYSPVIGKNGEVVGVIETYHVPRAAWAMIHNIRMLVWVVLMTGGGLLYLGLFGIVKRAYLRQAALEDALRASEASFQAIVAKSADGILVVDEDEVVRYVNPAGEALLNDRGGKLLGRKLGFPVKNDGMAEVHIRRTSGGKGVAEMLVSETDWKGERAHLVSLRDVTDNVELREKLFNLSITDELTGLSNRRGFMQLAQQRLNVAKRTGSELVLIYVDMDGMKRINDTYGHQEGDQALIDVANILKDTFRESDIVARIGGDEFTVLAAEVRKGDVDFPIARLREKIAAHNANAGRPYTLSVSVGVAWYDPKDPCSIDDLLVRADASMYEQKWGDKKKA